MCQGLRRSNPKVGRIKPHLSDGLLRSTGPIDAMQWEVATFGNPRVTKAVEESAARRMCLTPPDADAIQLTIDSLFLNCLKCYRLTGKS